MEQTRLETDEEQRGNPEGSGGGGVEGCRMVIFLSGGNKDDSSPEWEKSRRTE